MDVGFFTTARNTAPTIPSTTKKVTTSGYAAAGIGHATYAHDPAFDGSSNQSARNAFLAQFTRLAFKDSTDRLFRIVENPINILQAGAVADRTTDTLEAFQQVRDYLARMNVTGGTIFVPAGRFYVSGTITFPQHIRLLGEGNTQNPGIVDGYDYRPNAEYYFGSVLEFAAGVGGLDFLPHTAEEDMVTVASSIASLQDLSPYYSEQSATRSVVRDLFIYSKSNGAGTFDADQSGIQTRTTILLDNVWIHGFRGHGLRSEGTTNGAGGDGAMYGLPAQTVLANVKMMKNIGSGFRNVGREASVILLSNCDASHNGAWGYDDEGFLGNCYINCHATNNNQNDDDGFAGTGGSYRASGPSAAHTYIGCYVEDSGTTNAQVKLSANCMVIGGIMASQQFYGANETALVVNAAGGLRGTLSAFNDVDTWGGSPPTVRGGLGRDPARTQGTAVWFGSSDDVSTMDAYRIKYQSQAAKTWNVEYGNAGTSGSPIQLPVNGSNWRTSTLYAPSFPQGIILGANGAGPRLHYGTAAPTSGNWERGDIVINANAASGQPSYWQCTASGSPGTFAAGPNLA